ASARRCAERRMRRQRHRARTSSNSATTTATPGVTSANRAASTTNTTSTNSRATTPHTIHMNGFTVWSFPRRARGRERRGGDGWLRGDDAVLERSEKRVADLGEQLGALLRVAPARARERLRLG